MKLIHNLVVAAIMSSLTASVTAAEIDIYGKANLTVQSSDEGDGSFTEVKSNASRIGFKGTYDLGDGIDVIFKAEFQVDLDGDSAKGDSITDRNQYIGLRGAFGEVLLGKNDTMLKQSQGKVDLFSDLNGDIKSLWKGENRMADTISYKSPALSGLQLGVTYVAEDSLDGEDATSIALFYGDKELKKSPLFASIAIDTEMKGYDAKRATISGKLAGVILGAILHTQEKLSNGEELDGLLISAKYGFDKITVKGQFQTASVDGGDDKSGFTLGADYKLAKSTRLFTFFTSFDMDSGSEEEYLGAGIEYKF